MYSIVKMGLITSMYSIGKMGLITFIYSIVKVGVITSMYNSIVKVGLITKKWMGCWKETLTDADNFQLTFNPEMDISEKECFRLNKNSLVFLCFNTCLIPSNLYVYKDSQ